MEVKRTLESLHHYEVLLRSMQIETSDEWRVQEIGNLLTIARSFRQLLEAGIATEPEELKHILLTLRDRTKYLIDHPESAGVHEQFRTEKD